MRQSSKNNEATWFGFQKIDPDKKNDMVEEVFDSVAGKYDLMNDVMSGGIHRLWKNRFVSLMQPNISKVLLDVAGGTGDIAFRYRARAGKGAKITVCDINQEMLKVGKNRAIDRGYVSEIDFVHGNAEKLHFKDASYDLYSISFGLRNVPKIDDALEEAYRVLKIGGAFYCLEFSRVNNDLLRKLYDEYSFRLIPAFGGFITQDRNSYQYLVESIRQFPPQKELEKRIKAAGFDKTRVINLSGGIAAIHIGYKL